MQTKRLKNNQSNAPIKKQTKKKTKHKQNKPKRNWPTMANMKRNEIQTKQKIVETRNYPSTHKKCLKKSREQIIIIIIIKLIIDKQINQNTLITQQI